MKQNLLYKSLRIYRLACAKRKIIQTQPSFQSFYTQKCSFFHYMREENFYQTVLNLRGVKRNFNSSRPCTSNMGTMVSYTLNYVPFLTINT